MTVEGIAGLRQEPETGQEAAAPAAVPALVPALAPAPAPTLEDFARVYQQHFAFVWRSLLRLGVPEASAEDAAQDVFVVVHRQLARFAQRSSLKTWLFGIAINVARDHRRTVRRKGGDDALEELTVEPSTGAEGETARLAAAQLLDRALDALDDEKRAVFILAELEGMTAPEIAAATGLVLNTVYSRLRVAREQFENAFAALGGHP